MNKVNDHHLLLYIAKKALLSEPKTGWYYSEVPNSNDYMGLAKEGLVRLAGNTVRISQKGKEYCSYFEPDYDWQDWEDNTNVLNIGV